MAGLSKSVQSDEFLGMEELLHLDPTRPFSNIQDAVERLLPFHVSHHFAWLYHGKYFRNAYCLLSFSTQGVGDNQFVSATAALYRTFLHEV